MCNKHEILTRGDKRLIHLAKAPDHYTPLKKYLPTLNQPSSSLKLDSNCTCRTENGFKQDDIQDKLNTLNRYQLEYIGYVLQHVLKCI